ncbi:MAG: hypothetical protein WBF66_04570 [Dehalococcoidia bacterium]
MKSKKSGASNPPEAREAASLRALLAEYDRLSTNSQNYMSRVFVIITLGAATLGVVVSQIPRIQEAAAQRAVYFALPLAFTILFVLIVEQLWLMVLEGYHLRAVERRIGQVTENEDIFRLVEAEAHGFYSVRSGPLKHMLSYAAMFVAAGAAYLGVTAYCVWGMTRQEVPWPLVAAAVFGYAVAISLVLTAFQGALLDSKSIYEQAMSGRDIRDSRSLGVFGRTVGYLIVPRLFDFIVKAPLFWIGVIAGVVAARVTDSLSLSEFKSGLGEIAFAFVIVEYVVNQGKYMWNDVRDRHNDRSTPGKERRLLATYPSGPIVHMVSVGFLGRTGLGLALAVLSGWYFGHWALFPLTLGLIGTQAIYEFWGKVGLWRRLGVTTAGYVLRAVAGLGVTAVALSLGREDTIVMGAFVSTWVAVFAVGFLGAWWRAESQHARERGVDPESIRHGLGGFEAAKLLHRTAAVASVLVASGIVVPLEIIGGGWTGGYAAVCGPLVIGLLALGLAPRLPRGLALSGLLQIGLMAAIAATILSILGVAPAALVWNSSFPVFASCMALFFLNARHEDLVIQIPVKQVSGTLFAFYRLLFALGPPRGVAAS